MKSTRRNALLLIISLLLLTSACQPTPTASPLTGTLSELSGRVESKSAAETVFQSVAAGDMIQVNDQVQTGDDGRVRVDLSSGTLIRVAPSSLFTLTSNDPVEGGLTTKLKLQLGRIFVILKGGSVDVETPSGVASVRGSYMMVEIDPETQDVIVTCLEGNCSAGGINFTDGQKVVFHYDPATGKYGAPSLEKMSEEDFRLWLENNPEAQQIYNQILAGQSAATATPTPSASPTPTSQTTIVTNTEPDCFSLQAPPDGALINATGLVTFTWEPQDGAASYEVVFTSPGGARNTLVTTSTSLDNFIDIFPFGGTYSWEVTALRADGTPICTAKAFAFSKPVSPALEPPAPPEKTSCTQDDAQWTNPSAPCYCNIESSNNPRYCKLPVEPTPAPTKTPLPTPTPTYYPQGY
ncbi:MAG: FecR domain-containing protein [Chloroflexota bacterium]